jgi:uncharacterized membrane protein (DUF106 family)
MLSHKNNIKFFKNIINLLKICNINILTIIKIKNSFFLQILFYSIIITIFISINETYIIDVSLFHEI